MVLFRPHPDGHQCQHHEQCSDGTVHYLLAARRSHLARDLTKICFVLTILSAWRMHSLHQFATFHSPNLLLPPPSTKTIAYVTSLTGCDPDSAYLDGAAVLRYSIRRFDSTKYNSKFYAFVHPNAVKCSSELSRMGYEVQVRPTPINVTDIRGPLKKYVEGASCCGSAEFLKLYSYTLVDHPVVVHLDMDVVVLKPLEDLFDSMLEGLESPARHRLPAMWANNVTDLPKQIDAFFTRDYSMIRSDYQKPLKTCIQGGFLVVRPDRAVFQEYIDTILEGQYDRDSGWGGPELRYGGRSWGAAQIQGLVAYFYGHLHPRTSVELNRCKYNNMVDSPERNDLWTDACLSPREDGFCEDCRLANLSNVWTSHYTICRKPWTCYLRKEKLCRELHHEWFRLRLGLENEIKKSNHSYSIIAMNKTGEMPWIVEGNKSFCTQEGSSGYIKMQQYA